MTNEPMFLHFFGGGEWGRHDFSGAHDSPHRGPEISFAEKDPFLSSGVAGGGAKN